MFIEKQKLYEKLEILNYFLHKSVEDNDGVKFSEIHNEILAVRKEIRNIRKPKNEPSLTKLKK